MLYRNKLTSVLFFNWHFKASNCTLEYKDRAAFCLLFAIQDVVSFFTLYRQLFAAQHAANNYNVLIGLLSQ